MSCLHLIAAAIWNPYQEYKLFRNLKAMYAGNLMRLSDFLALAKNASSISGVLIGIEVSLIIHASCFPCLDCLLMLFCVVFCFTWMFNMTSNSA